MTWWNYPATLGSSFDLLSTLVDPAAKHVPGNDSVASPREKSPSVSSYVNPGAFVKLSALFLLAAREWRETQDAASVTLENIKSRIYVGTRIYSAPRTISSIYFKGLSYAMKISLSAVSYYPFLPFCPAPWSSPIVQVVASRERERECVCLARGLETREWTDWPIAGTPADGLDSRERVTRWLDHLEHVVTIHRYY